MPNGKELVRILSCYIRVGIVFHKFLLTYGKTSWTFSVPLNPVTPLSSLIVLSLENKI